MLLNGKAAAITGAGSGIGRAAAILMAANGARIAVIDRDEPSARATVDQLEGVGHLALVCDVALDEACADVARTTLAAFGTLDVLVNNAGYAEDGGFLTTSMAQWRRTLEVNVLGMVHMTRAFIPAMQAAHSGSIIMMSSAAGQRGARGFGGPHYATSKAAVLGLTKSLAREFADDGIRVNCVAPGFVDTNLFQGRLDADTRASIIAGIPLGRGGAPDEIAGAILFLGSDLSTFVTGATLDVNGGGNMR